jgi:hypothetical protein
MYQVEKAYPFPTLKADESAVSMVGISPLDTLLLFWRLMRISLTNARSGCMGIRYGVQNFESP